MRMLLRVIGLVPLTLVACTTAVEPTRIPSPAVAVLDRPAEHAAVSGVVQVSGWALHPQGPITRVDLLLDGRTAGTATYGRARPDVCEVYRDRPACPNVGWESSVDLARATPGEHQLRARVTGPFGDQTETAPRSIVVEAHEHRQSMKEGQDEMAEEKGTNQNACFASYSCPFVLS